MVCIVTPQAINVQRHQGMVTETLEKLVQQIHVKITNAGARIRDVILQPRAPEKSITTRDKASSSGT